MISDYFRRFIWRLENRPSDPNPKPFSTAVPFWGQTTYNLSGLPPKWDCSPNSPRKAKPHLEPVYSAIHRTLSSVILHVDWPSCMLRLERLYEEGDSDRSGCCGLEGKTSRSIDPRKIHALVNQSALMGFLREIHYPQVVTAGKYT